jgi:hypothetical protein
MQQYGSYEKEHDEKIGKEIHQEINSEVRQRGGQERRARDEVDEEGDAEVRGERQEGHESQAGNRDWFERGAEVWCEGAEEKE